MSGRASRPGRSTRKADVGRERAVRLSETVGPYGPGAVVDILGESFMAPTGDEWPSARHLQEVDCARLADQLGVSRLFAAPSQSESARGGGVRLRFTRFPSWLFCQKCRRTQRLRSTEDDGATPICNCGGRLVPMRFVAICADHSHVQDIDWPRWLHEGPAPAKCDPQRDVRFRANERGFGLASLELHCESCGATRGFDELDGNRLKGAGIACHGRQPWQTAGAPAACGAPLVVQQRGATSMHFGESVSAIDIPEVVGRAESMDDAIRRNALFAGMEQQEDEDFRRLLAERIAVDVGCSSETVLTAARGANQDRLARAKTNILNDEFEAFEAAFTGEAPIENFVTRVQTLDQADNAAASLLRGLVRHVILVDRLREVRASVEFRRYRMDATAVPAVMARQGDLRWLPAVEGWGEGIFVRLDGEAIERWAESGAISDRVAKLASNQSASPFATRFHEATPAYVLLHSLSHILMQELAFTSGYTAASLRERIYAGDGSDAGIFIYTTTSDYEGTLGGLVRQGESGRFPALLLRGLERHDWCSNDPVCRESGPQSLQGLNLAACHTCLLVSETSCEASNLLLDRACLVGNDDVEGLFSTVVSELRRRTLGEVVPWL